MDTITIAHLSDLHFDGTEAQLEVWQSLRKFLNKVIKPSLILITGDIVDTPDEKLYALAQKELNELETVGTEQLRYRICPGNHDRHPYGNAPGALGRFWRRIRPSS